jgi:hypothetical protein
VTVEDHRRLEMAEVPPPQTVYSESQTVYSEYSARGAQFLTPPRESRWPSSSRRTMSSATSSVVELSDASLDVLPDADLEVPG